MNKSFCYMNYFLMFSSGFCAYYLYTLVPNIWHGLHYSEVREYGAVTSPTKSARLTKMDTLGNYDTCMRNHVWEPNYNYMCDPTEKLGWIMFYELEDHNIFMSFLLLSVIFINSISTLLLS